MAQPKGGQSSGPPRNPGLLKFIKSKRQWDSNRAAEAQAAGFKGWHERGYLPHFDAPGVTQFVTFMLTDAFPVKRRAEWESLTRDTNDSDRQRKIEQWIDRGHGECWLRQPALADRLEQILRSQNGTLYAPGKPG